MTSPGGRRHATLKQVADLAGVSVMTASYTYGRPARVSDEARAKVLAAAAALGYAGPDPKARSLRSGKTRTIGVVLGEHLPYAFEDPQAAAFLAGIAEVCAERAYGMTILPAAGQPDDADRIRDAAVDGFVVWTTTEDDPALAAVRASDVPAVVHGGPRTPGMGLVTIDNRAAARAVGEVVFAGARRPAIVGFPLSRRREAVLARGLDPAVALYPVTRQRLEGYREAAEALGIAWDAVTVAVCARNTAADGEQAAAMLLGGVVGEVGGVAGADAAGGSEPPDAIAAMSDQLAVGVLRAAGAAGRAVPVEVAVAGWDDSSAAAELGLSTVAQSLREQGAECAQVALGLKPDDGTASWHVVRRLTTRPE